MERRKTHVANRAIIYALAFSLGSAILTAVVCVIYTGSVDRESNHKLCGMVIAVDEAFRNAPPGGTGAQNIASAFHKLRQDFEC